MSEELVGKKILLRKPKESDIEDRFKSGRNKEITRMYGGDTRRMTPYTKENAINWYNRSLNVPYFWMIEYEKQCIGHIRLTINETDKRAKLGIGIFDPTKLGKGLGTEATQLILDYAFNTLNLHKVDLRVLEYNTRAIKSYQKCGFIIEGKDREGALIEDKWETDLMMSILEHEYRNLYNHSLKI